MIKRSIEYQNELYTNLLSIIDNPKYMYFHASSTVNLNSLIPNIETISYQNSFVSINDGKIIGFISYDFDNTDLCTYNWKIISFEDKPNIVFSRDVLTVIDDAFCKYNFNKIEFSCVSGNPILKVYRRFIKKYNGVEVGCRKQHCILIDRKYHDMYYFDIFAEGYKRRKYGNNNK